MNESKKMALLAVEALEDKKAEDITIIDISEVSVLADYFIIADGSNRNQVQAMADSAEEALGGVGLGLALVHEIVRVHDGSIFVKDNANSGTTFEVIFS